MAGLKVFGKTEQMTTTGKNLLNQHSSNWQSEEKTNGITYTYVRDSDGNLLYINADGPNTTTSNSHAKKAFTTLPAGTYTVTGCPSGYGSAVALRVGKGASGTYMEVDQGSGYTFTLTEETIISINPMVGAGKTVSNVKFYPMIRLASITDPTYEPYTGGIPSPNPEYPQELKSVGDGGSVDVTVAGKNLYDINKYPLTQGKYIHSNGGHADSSNFAATMDYIPVNHLKGKVITLNKRPGGSLPGVGFYDVNHSILSHQRNNDITAGTPMVINVPEDAVYMRFTVPANTYEIQIEHGSTATAYEPYKEVQTMTVQTPNGLPGIPVSSGGNYTDDSEQEWICDEVDFEKGVYVQRVATKNYNGSETWTISSLNAPFATSASDIMDCTDTDIRLLCNRYPAINISDSWVKYDYLISRAAGNSKYLQFRNVNISTLEEWKAHLDENPITVQYILAEEKHIPLSEIDPDALAQYATLHTNYPNTTIFNDAGAHMEVSYIADTKMYVDKKFEELAEILINKL